ncbi:MULTISPECIES: Zn-dependent hydrolase [Bradyrhizobium]|uniref:N-carbamoyl-beta-alanine amidohydrolase n=1 Tax=Bradyrhizobium diazoefficiens (strain JCM 10833 / BCRC 13528 / IAM 13628 / NBRC 14792 / USDA 110) TaxID=224911 RepID=Q89Q07_BRADU|nr:Zn-dependent hydrolase [Bradyrhizobium diazoefficiens]AND88739.1 allantoate amidohydrolase [Bradyrhizobium diazoefficiens USDA 110]AWO90305.1 Zn-dependent hydrolase [Bradyrhizobium diazoefficiens]PDT63044.1 Zn-dependent hydrolase [Bradyrhizobium diazoefficiens]QBP22123.1 Zn-dependent hydrolase [Bradyrhizobium diazoefficiens]QLD44889.1 Zn-dependent hydrolase [Bradyrhizobium diazoefficiens]
MGSSTLINADRLWTRLMALAEIGATPAGGVNRQALSDGEIAAWRRVIGWAREAGLTPSTDAAGNLFLTLAGRDRAASPVLLGSHLDSQPTGGKFDGAAGVMAALEAAVSLAEQSDRPARDVIVVAWMNEEGSRFAPGMMGSEAFTGERNMDAIRAARDADGISVGEALDRLHQALPDVPHRPLGFAAGAYLELHIEQGPLLEAADCAIGVVTGIQGKKTFQVVVEGAEGHAGTLAQQERRDALAAFARMASALHAEIGTVDADIKFTIGRVAVVPNAPSVVPSRVSFSIDLRHPDNAVLDAAGARIAALCQQNAAPCAVTVTPLVDAPSNAFDPRLRASIAEAARAQGHSAMEILSAAGHDARHLAKICPAAMIFIPCRDGASHVEHEWAEPDHVAAGASVLAQVLRELAFAPGIAV